MPNLGDLNPEELLVSLDQLFKKMQATLRQEELLALALHFMQRHCPNHPDMAYVRRHAAQKDSTRRTDRRRGRQTVYRWFDAGIVDPNLKPIFKLLFTGKI
ncbi:MAG: hypothetical protein AAF483_00415 [Planctomycetota bacterium]